MATGLDYPFTVRPLTAEEGGGYLIEFPDLPSCLSDGATIEEAIANGADALRSWIETARELDDPIPPPSRRPLLPLCHHPSFLDSNCVFLVLRCP